MALREILAHFGIDVDTKPLEGLNSKIESAIEGLQHFGKALLAAEVVKGIGEFVHSAIEIGDNLRDTADKLGVGTEELQRFQLGASLAGGSAEGAATSLNFLNKAIGHATEGNQEAIGAFAKLGVRFKDADGNARPLLDIVRDMGDGFTGLATHGEKTATAMSLLGRSGAELLPFFKDGSKGVEELLGKLDDAGGAIGEDFINMADEASDQLKIFDAASRGLKTSLASLLIPWVTKATEGLTRFVSLARKMNEQTNIGTILVAALGVAAAITAGKLSLQLVRALGLVRAGALGVARGFAAFFAYAALIAGIVLVVEDLYTLFTGGESVIGKWLEKLYGVEGAKQIVQDFRDVVKEVETVFVGFQPVLEDIGKLLKSIWTDAAPYVKDFVSVLTREVIAETKRLLQFLSAGLSLVTGDLKNFDKKMGDALKGNDLGSAVISLATGDLKGFDQKVGNVLNGTNIGNVLNDPTGSKAASVPANYPGFGVLQNAPSVPSPIMQTNQNTINVYGQNGQAPNKGDVKDALRDVAAEQRAALAAVKR